VTVLFIDLGLIAAVSSFVKSPWSAGTPLQSWEGEPNCQLKYTKVQHVVCP